MLEQKILINCTNKGGGMPSLRIKDGKEGTARRVDAWKSEEVPEPLNTASNTLYGNQH